MEKEKEKDRRFLISGIVLIVFLIGGLTALFIFTKHKEKDADFAADVKEETLEVAGLSREYRIYFLADSHISLCDDMDEELKTKATQRADMFRYNGTGSDATFRNLIKDAVRRKPDLVILGGDITDSAMYASVDCVNEELALLDSKGIPYLYYSGNHDFEYGDEYFTQTAYEEYLPRLNSFHGGESYTVTEYDDLIVFTADDANNQISEEALEAFREVVTRGKPVVLGIHVPLEPATDDSSFVEICKTTWGADPEGKSRVSIGPNGCYMNDTTQEFRDLVLAEDSPVVLVLGGHVHFFHKDELNERTIQIVTGAAYEAKAVEVTLKPASN